MWGLFVVIYAGSFLRHAVDMTSPCEYPSLYVLPTMGRPKFDLALSPLASTWDSKQCTIQTLSFLT